VSLAIAGVLAPVACGFDLSGVGVAASADMTDASSIDGAAPADDAAAPVSDAAQVDACGIACLTQETVSDELTDETLVDPLETTNVRVSDGGASLEPALTLGTGADGACVVNPATAIDLTIASCSGRGTPDAALTVLTADAAASSVSLSVTMGASGFATGDEIAIVDMQGDPNVAGKYELARVASAGAGAIVLSSPLSVAHLAANHPTIIRVPNYASLAVAAGGTIALPKWAGTAGGLLFVRVQGTAAVSGLIEASGAGFRGAPRPSSTTKEDGLNGEGTGTGFGANRVRTPAVGGGGGGRGDNCGGSGVGGGGGGHGAVGAAGSDPSCAGLGGAVYGGVDRVTLGSGGGSGGNDNSLSTNPIGGAGGAGGGALYLEAQTINVAGQINANGFAGQGDSPPCTSTSNSTSMCWDFSGPGGGGSGGAVFLRAESLSVTGAVRALGGAGGVGYNNFGGAGGAGRVVTAAVTRTGATTPAETTAPVFPVSGVLQSKDLLAGKPPALAFVNVSVVVTKRPSTAKVRLLVSSDAQTWLPAMPPSATSLLDGTTTVALDQILGASASFYYRIVVDGDGLETPIVDRVSVVYAH